MVVVLLKALIQLKFLRMGEKEIEKLITKDELPKLEIKLNIQQI